MFFPWEWLTGEGKAEQVGLSSHQFSYLSQDTFSEQLSCAPRCLICFHALPLKKAHPFSTLNPQNLLCLSHSYFILSFQAITYIGGEETQQ